MVKSEDIGDQFDVETKVSTDADTETETEIGVEPPKRVVNLCDILKQAIDKQVDETEADEEEYEYVANEEELAQEEVEVDSDEEARAHIKKVLQSALADGSLLDAVQQLKQDKEKEAMENARAKARDTLFASAMDGRLHAAFAAKKTMAPADTNIEVSRANLKDLLVNATRDGRLDSAFSQMMQQRKECRTTEETHETNSPVIEDLRMSAAQTLKAAALNGNLHAALKEVQIKKLRTKAREQLLAAAEDGRLVSALEATETQDQQESSPQEKLSIDYLRKMLAKTLLNGMENNKLSDALKEVSEESLRARSREALGSALCDGRFEKACAEVAASRAKPQVCPESLRMRAKEAFCGAALEGRLTKVFNEVATKQGKVMPQADSKIDVMRRQAGNLLLEAANDGRLKELLSQNPKSPAPAVEKEEEDIEELLSQNPQSPAPAVEKEEEDIEDLRSKVRSTFAQAALSGNLEKAFTSHPQVQDVDLRSRARDLLLEAFHTGQLEQTLRQETQAQAATDTEAARVKARSLLVSSFGNGRLEEACEEIRQMRQTREVEDAQAAKEDAQAAKRKALSLLQRGSLDGSLERALMEVQQTKRETTPDIEQIRSSARTFLMEAALNGKLRAACSEVVQQKREQEIEEARLMAQKVVLKGVSSGRLATAFNEVKQERAVKAIEDARVKCQKVLVQAVSSGKLEAACAKVHEEKERALTEARMKAQNSLVQAALSGRLEAICQEVKNERLQQQRVETTSSAREPPRAQPESSDRSTMDAVRTQLRDIFVKAAEEGRLRDAFQEVKQRRESEEELRSSTRHALFEAAESGRLEALLGKQAAPEPTPCADDMRLKLQHFLVSAAKDGRLASTLDEVAEQRKVTALVESPNIERLRCQVRDVLIASAASGELRCLLEGNLSQQDAQRAEDEIKVVPTAPTTTRVPTPTPPPEAERPLLEDEIEIVQEERKTVTPTKPQMARGAVRPSRFRPSKVEASTPPPQDPPADKLPRLSDSTSSARPLSSSSRSKRRIFGAITRAPVDAEETYMEAIYAAVPRTGSRHSIRRLQAEAREGLAQFGTSSLSLGATSMKGSSQRRSASFAGSSAMAMDLGLDGMTAPPPKAPRSSSQSAGFHFTKSSKAEGLSAKFLPTLGLKQSSMQPLAPNFALGADASKWDLSRAVF